MKIQEIKNFYLESFLGLNYVCWLSVLYTFIEAVLSGIVFFLSFYFVKALHFNVAAAATFISCYGIGTAFGGALGGKCVDLCSTRFVATISLITESVAFFGLFFTHSTLWLMSDLFLLGVATYGFLTANNIGALRACHQKEKLKLIALGNTASNLGIGISAILAGFLGVGFFKEIFFGFACASLLLSILNYAYPLIPTATPKGENSFRNAPVKEKTRPDSFAIHLIFVCLFFVGLIVVQRSTTYSIYLNNTFKNLNTTGLGLLFALNPLLIILFQNPVVSFFRAQNKMRSIGIGALCIGLGMGLLSFSSSIFFAIFSCVIYTVGEMLFFSLAQLVVYELSPENKKGSSFGLFKTIYASSVTLGPGIGGTIYHFFGGHMIWYFSAAIGVVFFSLFAFYSLLNQATASY